MLIYKYKMNFYNTLTHKYFPLIRCDLVLRNVISLCSHIQHIFLFIFTPKIVENDVSLYRMLNNHIRIKLNHSLNHLLNNHVRVKLNHSSNHYLK